MHKRTIRPQEGHHSTEFNTVCSHLIHRNIFLFPLKSLIIYMEQLDAKNDKQIFTLIQRGNVCIIMYDMDVASGMWGDGESRYRRLYSSLTSLPPKERPSDPHITNRGERSGL